MHFVRQLVSATFTVTTICLALLAACGPPQTVTTIEGRVGEAPFPFLIDGRTPKTEIVGRLGDPDKRYEDGRIYSYPVELDNNRRWNVGEGPHAKNGKFRLILVFGPRDVLRRHSLVATSVPAWPDKSPK